MSDSKRIDRRRFLKLAGGGVGLAAAWPALSPMRAFASTTTHVGVLVPTGGAYAGMADAFLNGLALGFGQATGITASLVTEQVGLGFDGARPAATHLLDGGADVVVAAVSTLTAARLAGTFEERQTPLIVANVGAHAVRPGGMGPYALESTLHLWQGAYALGRWAAANAGRSVFVLSSLADAGYDTPYAFRRGFESAGGTFAGSVVTHEEPGADGLAPALAAAAASGADVLLACYAGQPAVELVQAYAASPLAGRVPLLGPGFLTGEDILARQGAAAKGIRTTLSWSRTLGTARSFVDAYRTKTGAEPDAFAVLGYDAAGLVAEGVRRAAASGLSTRRMLEALRGATLSSPRGQLTVGDDAVMAPLQLREVRKKDGRLTNVAIATLPAVAGLPAALQDLDFELASGYLNEYLCA